MFKHVIVRRPSPSIADGIKSAQNLGKPDYQQALSQHNDYINALQQCGVEITVLDADERYPDGCFVEDVALLTNKCAIITNPGVESRQGEELGMIDSLKMFYKNIERIQSPCSLEGGDVMMVGDHFYIGLSDRTNEEGAKQLINFLEKYGYTGSVINLKKVLHLKTGLSYLEDNILLVAGEFIGMEEFKSFEKIVIDENDSYSANCIRVNDFVLVPDEHESTRKAIEDAGLKTLVVSMSEFRKLDGGLSCLSLRF